MKKSILSSILLSSVLVLAACGNEGEAETDSTANNTPATTESTVATEDRTLIIYSNAVSDGRGDYFKDAATEAGFDIEFVDLGGTDLLNRIVAEKSAPIADMVFGLNDMNFEILRQEEILEPYKPNWIDEIANDVAIVEDNLYSPITMARVFQIYNADIIDSADAPKNWEDLHQNEAFKGKYRVQNQLGGATDTAAMYTQLVEFQDKNGEMGVSQKGWENLEAYFDNGYKTPEGEDWVQNFVDGKVPIAYTWMANVLTIEEQYGINVGIINPEYGIVQTTEQVGIVADGEDNTLEQAFMDWFGSEEVMRGFAELHNQMPAHEAARESAPAGLMEVMEQTTPQEIDFEWILQYIDEWVEYAELNLL